MVDDRVILAVKGFRFINVCKKKLKNIASFELVSSVNFSIFSHVISTLTNLASFVNVLISSFYCCTANSVCDRPEQNRSNVEIPTNLVTFVSTGLSQDP